MLVSIGFVQSLREAVDDVIEETWESTQNSDWNSVIERFGNWENDVNSWKLEYNGDGTCQWISRD